MADTLKKKPKNYLNNADLLAQLKLSHAQDRLTEEMGHMFMSLTKRYASIPRFSGYSYNDEMQSFALLTLAKVWRGFDASKYNNPFAYFTQVVHNAFHQLDNQERRQRDIRDAILVDQGKNPSFNYSERMSGSDNSDDFGDNDYMEVHDMDIKITTEAEEIVEEIIYSQKKQEEQPPNAEPPEKKEIKEE